MKRKASSLLLLILTTTFLYNVVGIHLLLTLQKEQAWVAVMQKIPDSEFKVIKMNATLYSFAEDTEMEYVNENVTINNKTYHVFKKKIQDNIISLYYLPVEKQSLSDINLKKLIDSDTSENAPLSKKSVEKIVKAFTKNYVQNDSNTFSFLNLANTNKLQSDFHPDGILHSGYLTRDDSPPDTV
jgi:hypothetical protein